jgi:hypothetical protein
MLGDLFFLHIWSQALKWEGCDKTEDQCELVTSY